MEQPKNISIDAQYIAPGLLRLNIMASNVPDNFLGAAFHLQIKGISWQLEKFSAGELFNNTDPLVLAAEKSLKDGTKEIVFGASLKNGQKISGGNVGSSNGSLAAIFLKTGDSNGESVQGNLQFEFSDEHFSVYEAGRKDLSDVTWQNASVDGQTLRTGLLAAHLQPSDLNVDLLAKSESQSLAGIYQFLGLMLFLAILAIGVYLWVRRNASKPR